MENHLQLLAQWLELVVGKRSQVAGEPAVARQPVGQESSVERPAYVGIRTAVRTDLDDEQPRATEFVPEMLDVPMHNSSFSTFDEGKGVTAEAVERWRDVLDPRLRIQQ